MPDRADRQPEALSADELCEEICTLAGQIAAATCRWLLLLAEFERRGSWSDGETKTCADWLSWRCSIMPATAREQLRVARRLTELPLITAAFAAGRLSYSKVRAITRVAEPATEEQLVMLAEHASGAQLERLVRGYRKAASACLETAAAAHERRYVRWEWDEDDGSLCFRGRLPADDGALLVAALEQAEQRLEAEAEASARSAAGGEPDLASPPPVPEGADPDIQTRQRNTRADALMSVARSALAAGPETVRAGGDPCQLVVHVDVETLAADDVAQRSDLEDGPSLAPETLRARDQGCTFPGCTHNRFLHAHHIRHWARGGATDIANLVLLCSHHHRLVHEGGYAVEVQAANPSFRRPDGTLVPDCSVPGRLRGPSVVERARRSAPPIDPSTCQATSAGQPLDHGIAVAGLLDRAIRARGRDPNTEPGIR